MLGFVFFIRTILALAAFVYFVLIWGFAPFRDSSIDMNVTVASVFFGNTIPSGWVRDLMLVSRMFFGLMISLYIFVPGLLYFFEFRATAYNNTIAILLMGASSAFFLIALVVHQLYFI